MKKVFWSEMAAAVFCMIGVAMLVIGGRMDQAIVIHTGGITVVISAVAMLACMAIFTVCNKQVKW